MIFILSFHVLKKLPGFCFWHIQRAVKLLRGLTDDAGNAWKAATTFPLFAQGRIDQIGRDKVPWVSGEETQDNRLDIGFGNQVTTAYNHRNFASSHR